MKNKIAIGIAGMLIALAALSGGWLAMIMAVIVYAAIIAGVKRFLALSIGVKIGTIILFSIAMCLVANWH